MKDVCERERRLQGSGLVKTSVIVVLQGKGLVKTHRRCAARDRASKDVCDSCATRHTGGVLQGSGLVKTHRRCAARDRASEDTQTVCCKGQG